MTRLINISIVCFAFVLSGCQHTRSSDGKEADSLPTLHANKVERRVDPRLLEETDERASSSAEEQARAYHKTTVFAEKFVAFQRSRVLAHGGYSARFGTRSNSVEGVRYYFDEQGRMMTTERRFPPY